MPDRVQVLAEYMLQGYHRPCTSVTAHEAHRSRVKTCSLLRGLKVRLSLVWEMSRRRPCARHAGAYARQPERITLSTLNRTNANQPDAQVRMLAGQSDGMSCNSGYRYGANCNTSIVPDVALAIARLREGFVFVGLTGACNHGD